MKVTRVFALSIDLVFPEGIAPGAGREGSHAVLARDGMGKPVLRGTALAGALRHSYESEKGGEGDRFFGCLKEDGNGRSRLLVPDVRLEVGGQDELTGHHIRINRHSGTVVDGALFSHESCPPGTSARVVFWLEAREDDKLEDFESFLRTLVNLLAEGPVLGGNGARGLGRVVLREDVPPKLRKYNLGVHEEYAAYLDDHRRWRAEGSGPGGGDMKPGADPRGLEVILHLTIPRGQDILIADGRGIEFDLEPQRVMHADGSSRWKLPGSSLRGLVRDWMVRLAARDGVEWVFDSGSGRAPGDLEPIPGHEYGKAGAKTREGVKCPVADLFGTIHGKGRIHISDGYAMWHQSQEQVRVHVAVDAVTGGARDEALFNNTVIISPPDHPVVFPVRIRISNPVEREVRWLAETIAALDQGLIRVGSSKAAGCLCLKRDLEARGKFREILKTIKPTRTGL